MPSPTNIKPSNNIYLIGFMAAGKSVIGRLLAQELTAHFIDLDAFIEEYTSKSIPQIFEEQGENTFRLIEKKCLELSSENTSEKHTTKIIATGGGTPCFFNNLSYLQKNGISIFLEVPAHILAQRLIREKNHRPLVQNFQDLTSLSNFLQSKLQERLPYYQQAQHIIHCEQNTPQQIVEKILNRLNQ